ncbi:tripartite motif-containing protein 44 [Brachyhypopomus gauderio]|uniref:tripartite motif-containing protein 44 n=1 Tax=Brachyhypopomus gauderio TaxID=698409 RepID=UPI0040438655
MNPPGACWDGGEDEDGLPQMDGTCDACEPDEAPPATHMCVPCSFAFCPAHGDEHRSSTRHQLLPYEPPPPQDAPAHNQEAASTQGDSETGGAGGGALGEEVGLGSRSVGGKRDTVTVERLRCKQHGQEGSLYCRQDEKIVCVVCAVQGEHREHEIITLKEAYLWQKSKEGIDLLACTQEMAEKIKTKWTSSDATPAELERYVNQRFDELHRLVRLEEWRVLHLVDLKEAFLTAQAAEKIAEISVHTERLQEEMDSITQQLGELDGVERNVAAPPRLGTYTRRPATPTRPTPSGAPPTDGPRGETRAA